MSRRTSESNKAIRKAWENEKRLVFDGKGTRDWSRTQQEQIIKYGKAYDEDGKAFEGHHMKSAEKHPEYQGDENNIQFLTRSEHKDAHGGDFRNPTNGYYNVSKKQTIEFKKNELIPCKINPLSAPVKRNKALTLDEWKKTIKDCKSRNAQAQSKQLKRVNVRSVTR